MNRREVLISQLLRAASGVMVDDEKVRDLCRLAADALAEALSPQEWVPTHRHLKSGGLYEVVGIAEAQVSCRVDGQPGTHRLLNDGCRLTVYRAENGRLWVRFADEFSDGRFEPLPAPPTPPFLSEGKGKGASPAGSDYSAEPKSSGLRPSGEYSSRGGQS